MFLYYLTGIIILPGFLLALFAQIKVTSAYSKYSKVNSTSGVTGYELAESVLRRRGLNIGITKTGGHITDHYDPNRNIVALSEGVYNSSSIAALSIAAHELGHVEQYDENYLPIKMRTGLVFAVNFTSRLMWPLLLAGLFFSFGSPDYHVLGSISEILIYLGLSFFVLSVMLSLITLPTELNASRRAIKILTQGGIITEQEVPMCKEVLSAAAFTYLASLIIAILQLLRMLLWLDVVKKR